MEIFFSLTLDEIKSPESENQSSESCSPSPTTAAFSQSSEDETLSTWTRTRSLHFKKILSLSDLLDHSLEQLRNAPSEFSSDSNNENILLY